MQRPQLRVTPGTLPAPGFGYGQPYAPPPPTNPLAITSLVLGGIALVTGLFCGVTLLLGPVAVILAVVALRAQSREPARWASNGVALGGLVTGILATLGLALVAAYFAWVMSMIWPYL